MLGGFPSSLFTGSGSHPETLRYGPTTISFLRIYLEHVDVVRFLYVRRGGGLDPIPCEDRAVPPNFTGAVRLAAKYTTNYLQPRQGLGYTLTVLDPSTGHRFACMEIWIADPWSATQQSAEESALHITPRGTIGLSTATDRASVAPFRLPLTLSLSKTLGRSVTMKNVYFQVRERILRRSTFTRLTSRNIFVNNFCQFFLIFLLLLREN